MQEDTASKPSLCLDKSVLPMPSLCLELEMHTWGAEHPQSHSSSRLDSHGREACPCFYRSHRLIILPLLFSTPSLSLSLSLCSLCAVNPLCFSDSIYSPPLHLSAVPLPFVLYFCSLSNPFDFTVEPLVF